MLEKLECSVLDSSIQYDNENIDREELIPSTSKINDDEFTPSKTSHKQPETITPTLHTPSQETRFQTRKQPENDIKSANSEELKHPSIRVRSGFKSINPKIKECLVVMESMYKVEGRKCAQLLAYIANTVFDQNWQVEEEPQEKREDEKAPIVKKRQKDVP